MKAFAISHRGIASPIRHWEGPSASRGEIQVERECVPPMQKSSYRWAILFILVFGTAMLNFSNLIFASRPTDVMAQFNMTQGQLTAISTVGQLPGASSASGSAICLIKKVSGCFRVFCWHWQPPARSGVFLQQITSLCSSSLSWPAPSSCPLRSCREKCWAYGSRAKRWALQWVSTALPPGIGTTLAFAFGNHVPVHQRCIHLYRCRLCD